METLKTLFLGIIQGLTEFLPVSSSGHLVLAQTFMGAGGTGESGSAMLLEVMLHVATGIAVLWVFRKDIAGIITGCVSKDTIVRKESLTYSGWIILGTIPAAFVGIFFNNQIEALFDTSKGTMPAYLTSFMLFVTAGLLLFSSWKKSNGADGGKLTLIRVIAIGLIQAVAITPGISRSGSTIAMALLVGVSRTEAGRFSFMLALPAIFGAALLEARHVESWGALMTVDLAAGFIASLVVGIVALKLLLTFIQKGKLHYFGYYCAAAAVVSLALLTFFPPVSSGG
ncbi:MAG: undecaprenyl-diphosphate phosphatase [Chitinispirillia bacterium]|nr:undecaprenyl-diphosphate phosphatase [Chitinispirillia bacterium]MCL2267853.1 undecaprenyl-diphosphate phosphatase [Chitinispirillia bacterium]